MANRRPRLDWIHQAHADPIFFITFNTIQRARILATTAVHECFVAFAREAQVRNITVGRYVIMPDHVHLFVRGGPDFVLTNWVRMLRRCLSKAIVPPLPHWQEGFHDHLLRHGESYAQKWEYVWQNPVRAGVVPAPDLWPYQGAIVADLA